MIPRLRDMLITCLSGPGYTERVKSGYIQCPAGLHGTRLTVFFGGNKRVNSCYHQCLWRRGLHGKRRSVFGRSKRVNSGCYRW
jgi:hypothetical protein